MTQKIVRFVSTVLFITVLLLTGSAYGQAAGPDFSKATEALGVSAAELTEAIGGPPPDFAGAAKKFGVSVAELLALLPAPPASDIPEGYTAKDFMQP